MQTDLEILQQQYRQLHEQLTQVQQHSQSQSAELLLLRELAVVLQHGQSFDHTCGHLLHTIINNTVAQNCSIMILHQPVERLFLAGATDPQRKNFVLPVDQVLHPGSVAHGFKLGEGAAGESLATQQVVLIEDVLESDQFVAHPATQVEIGSLLCVPLIVQDQPFGVLNLSHSKGHAFQSHDLYLFNIVAGFVALAMHNALEHERQVRQCEDLLANQPSLQMDPLALLANGISHDLNNVLAGLVGYAELLELQLGEDDRFKSSFSAIQDAGRKAAEIVDNLAALGGQEIDEVDPIDLNLIIKQYLFDVSFRQLVDAHPDILFDHTLDDSLPEIQGRMEGLLKVLDKFFVYAYEATDRDGRIEFDTGAVEIDSARYPKARQTGPHILMRLQFGGPALTPEEIQHLFVPYYPKNHLGIRSGGLGLAIAARIIQLHRGWVDVLPLDSGGNAFYTYLPVFQESSI